VQSGSICIFFLLLEDTASAPRGDAPGGFFLLKLVFATAPGFAIRRPDRRRPVRVEPEQLRGAAFAQETPAAGARPGPGNSVMGRLNVSHKLIASHLVAGEMAPEAQIAIRIDQPLTQDATGALENGTEIEVRNRTRGQRYRLRRALSARQVQIVLAGGHINLVRERGR
jgi:hypothetical protein